MANDQTAREVFVSSREKAMNGYGQNGYTGPSSDCPKENTTSGFLPEVKVVSGDWQTRKVDATQITATFGMKSPVAPAKIGGGNIRTPSKRAMGGNFQR